MKLDFNLSNCMVYVTKWFQYEFTNVCTGQIRYVPWGISEYFLLAFAVIAVLCLVAFLLVLAGRNYYVWRFFKNRKDKKIKDALAKAGVK